MAAHALEIARPVGWLRQVASAASTARASSSTAARTAPARRSRARCRKPGGAIFVVTLGPQVDERVLQLFEAMDGLEGLFLDTAGWVVVQSALSAFVASWVAGLAPTDIA
jgi:hypothetical protein